MAPCSCSHYAATTAFTTCALGRIWLPFRVPRLVRRAHGDTSRPAFAHRRVFAKTWNYKAKNILDAILTLNCYKVPDERPCHPNDRFQPERWMHHVERFQAFAETPIEQLVAPFQPWKLGSIAAACSAMKINEHVIICYELV